MGHFHGGEGLLSQIFFLSLSNLEGGINKGAILNEIECNIFFEAEISEEVGIINISFFLRLSNLKVGD